MNRVIALICIYLVAWPAGADGFIGMRMGPVWTDVSADKNPRNLALNAGYQINTFLSDLSIGVEASRTLIEGELGNGGDLEFETESICLFGRTSRSLFLCYRAGLVRYDRIRDHDTHSDDGLLLGGGFGIVAGADGGNAIGRHVTPRMNTGQMHFQGRGA